MIYLDKNSTKSQTNKISDAFSESKLFYNNVNVFDFYMDRLDQLEKAAKIGEKVQEYDYEENEVVTVRLRGQEVFLGYSPSLDKFFVGFDIWGVSNYSLFLSFGISESQKIEDIDFNEKSVFEGNFYNTTYKELKKSVKDIIEIRLD